MHAAVDRQVYSILMFAKPVEASANTFSFGQSIASFCNAIKCSHHCSIAIPTWHRRTSVAFSSETTRDIPAIFDQQGIEFVLWMVLKKYKQALALFSECIIACISRHVSMLYPQPVSAFSGIPNSIEKGGELEA